MRRKTAEDYHKLAESRGIKWLGSVVSNTHTKTGWECAKEHQWEARYADIYRGSGCPHCVGLIPKTSGDYHILSKRQNVKWLGPEVPNVRTKTWWECEQSHRWETSYDKIRQGKGCPYCARCAPKILGDYHILAQKRGFKWMGSELPPNTRTNTPWKCEKNHIWKTSYSNIHHESGCPHCSNKAPKTPEDYHALARGRGFKWIDSKVVNVETKTFWECEQKHRWQACYDSIRQGTGCPVCANRVPKMPIDYHALAKERGFKWIGLEHPAHTGIKTTWECDGNHHWEACYSNIQQGKGCPECVDKINGFSVSKNQRRLCEMLNGILNYPFGHKRIDVALANEKIAVEYDSWYWHRNRKEYDERRNKELVAADWKVLCIKSNNKLPSQNQLLDALVQLRTGKINHLEIILDDWGHGSTFAELRI